jgi:hypothetical protein
MKKQLSNRRDFVKKISVVTAATAVSPLMAGEKISAKEAMRTRKVFLCP